MHRFAWRPLVAVLTLLVLTIPDAGAVARPLEHRRPHGDPSITKVGPRQYVALATGMRVTRMVSTNGARWRPIGPALQFRPSWARRDSGIWAADLVHVKRRWLLYYAAPVRGMGRSSRCIGVASSRTSTGRFRPVGHRPLICPPAAHTPRAEDRILDARRSRPTYPTIGAIDPSAFLDRGRVFLLYKTDGKPSSIRILPLRSNGLHARGRSRSLLSARGVLENPVMMRRGRSLYLFMSAGDYTRCTYSTVWRRSDSLYRWRGHPQRTLLAKRSTGLCGPGGADVVVDRAAVRLYFHGWTCRGTARPCADPFNAAGHREDYRRPVRALYGAWLRFSRSSSVRLGPYIKTREARPQRAKKQHGKRHHAAKHHRAKKHHGKRRHHATRHHRVRKHHATHHHRVEHHHAKKHRKNHHRHHRHHPHRRHR